MKEYRSDEYSVNMIWSYIIIFYYSNLLIRNWIVAISTGLIHGDFIVSTYFMTCLQYGPPDLGIRTS
jgi:uncharacterized protein YneF (UPF0154 family)